VFLVRTFLISLPGLRLFESQHCCKSRGLRSRNWSPTSFKSFSRRERTLYIPLDRSCQTNCAPSKSYQFSSLQPEASQMLQQSLLKPAARAKRSTTSVQHMWSGSCIFKDAFGSSPERASCQSRSAAGLDGCKALFEARAAEDAAQKSSTTHCWGKFLLDDYSK
jgi:hypothetical protein